MDLNQINEYPTLPLFERANSIMEELCSSYKEYNLNFKNMVTGGIKSKLEKEDDVNAFIITLTHRTDSEEYFVFDFRKRSLDVKDIYPYQFIKVNKKI